MTAVPDGTVIATCTGCSKPIITGTGLIIDATGQSWHPLCRQASKVSTPKRRGRPPKAA